MADMSPTSEACHRGVDQSIILGMRRHSSGPATGESRKFSDTTRERNQLGKRYVTSIEGAERCLQFVSEHGGVKTGMPVYPTNMLPRTERIHSGYLKVPRTWHAQLHHLSQLMLIVRARALMSKPAWVPVLSLSARGDGPWQSTESALLLLNFASELRGNRMLF